MFADISNASLGEWVIAGGIVIQIALAVIMIATRNDRQKREISFTGEPVDKDDFDAHVAEQAQADFRIWHQREEDRKELAREIADVRADIGALKKDCELGNQRSYQMDVKLDRLLSRK